MDRFKLFIPGAQTDNWSTVRSPFDESEIAEVEVADRNAVEQALANAALAFDSSMKEMPAYKRAEILYAVSEGILKNRDSHALTIAREGGKPLKDAYVEVDRAALTSKMAGDEALQLNGETISMDRSPSGAGHFGYTVRVPVGPVLAISAFNHPLNLICHQVCTAIAAGNSVVIKPASQTPISCLMLANYFKQAGLPEGALNVAVTSASVISEFVSDERIRFVSFIGSENVGWELRKKIAPGVRISLEHGGTAAAVIHKDADLELAIPATIKAAFYHSGQVCVSTQLLFVHADVEETVKQKLVKEAAKLKCGDPTDGSIDLGPLISPKEASRAATLIADATSKGAKLLTGGESLPNNCFQPTVLERLAENMMIFSEEAFAPILGVMPFSDLGDVIDIINRSKYSFQCAIYSSSVAETQKFVHGVQSKAVMINTPTAFRVDWMPFGGLRHSGLGVGGTRDAVREMTDEKLVVSRIRS